MNSDEMGFCNSSRTGKRIGFRNRHKAASYWVSRVVLNPMEPHIKGRVLARARYWGPEWPISTKSILGRSIHQRAATLSQSDIKSDRVGMSISWTAAIGARRASCAAPPSARRTQKYPNRPLMPSRAAVRCLEGPIVPVGAAGEFVSRASARKQRSSGRPVDAQEYS
jgi:hypothetical protein